MATQDLPEKQRPGHFLDFERSSLWRQREAHDYDPRARERTVSAPLLDEAQRKEAGLDDDTDETGRMRVIVELNILHRAGLSGAADSFRLLFRLFGDQPNAPQEPQPLTASYLTCKLSENELRTLAQRNSELESNLRPIFHIWPDFPVRPLIDKSVATIKGDAAGRAFDATGRGITWAVIDSGIDGGHEHFRTHKTLVDEDVRQLHIDFTVSDNRSDSALEDGYGHGTHVAGIIAGAFPIAADTPGNSAKPYALQRVSAGKDEFDFFSVGERFEERLVSDPTRLAGVAPRCKLVSLKVLDGKGQGHVSNVMRALQYIREELNSAPKLLRVQGVNLSLGYPFNAKWFACGQSPICVEVDRLVKSGVVVVTAAGNTGYGDVATQEGQRSTGMSLSINDPGNSDLAITVGATHRDSPHRYGVSYFSSKGPTGDGRSKPDILAPGESITSCATGEFLSAAAKNLSVPRNLVYVEQSGTSMAAPHVSGAIAAFLSIRQEYIGRPDDVKQIFMDSATSLGREPYFQGRGLVDLMRAIQSV